MKYEIEIRAVGYESLRVVVEADSLAEARKEQGGVLLQWAAFNDVDLATTKLAFVTICKLEKTVKCKGCNEIITHHQAYCEDCRYSLTPPYNP